VIFHQKRGQHFHFHLLDTSTIYCCKTFDGKLNSELYFTQPKFLIYKLKKRCNVKRIYNKEAHLMSRKVVEKDKLIGAQKKRKMNECQFSS